MILTFAVQVFLLMDNMAGSVWCGGEYSYKYQSNLVCQWLWVEAVFSFIGVPIISSIIVFLITKRFKPSLYFLGVAFILFFGFFSLLPSIFP